VVLRYGEMFRRCIHVRKIFARRLVDYRRTFEGHGMRGLTVMRLLYRAGRVSAPFRLP
jgi:hypothetical protein